MEMSLQCHEESRAVQTLQRTIIEPTLSLTDRIISSKEDFVIKADQYAPSPNFQIDFELSECEDISTGLKHVTPQSMQKNPALNLVPLYTRTPGLIMKKVESDNTFSPRTVTAKQIVMATWQKAVEDLRLENMANPTFFTDFCREQGEAHHGAKKDGVVIEMLDRYYSIRKTREGNYAPHN